MTVINLKRAARSIKLNGRDSWALLNGTQDRRIVRNKQREELIKIAIGLHINENTLEAVCTH